MVFSVVTIEKNEKFCQELTVIVPKTYLRKNDTFVFYSELPSSLDDLDLNESFIEPMLEPPPSFSLYKCRYEYDSPTYQNALILVEAIDKKNLKKKRQLLHKCFNTKSKIQC